METLDEVLAHHGILGMRWGVRRRNKSSGGGSSSSSSSHPGVSDDAQRARDSHSTIQSHKSTDPLSNKELQHLVNRINLEQQYSRLVQGSGNAAKVKKGFSAVKTVLGVAKTAQEVHSLANSALMKDIKKALH